MTTKCIIFDCDGTLVDSEGITNQVIAEMAGELGIEMTGDEASATFGGKTLDGVVYKMKELSGKELPDNWLPRLVQMVSDSWESKLRPVKGVKEILEKIEIPICVASNGEPTHVRHSLRLTNLYDFFGDNIFTASEVSVPKPAPDLFLYTAKKMGFNPDECVIIEDSITGVTAAVNANIRVYGIINNLFSKEDLEEAGAIPFTKMEELPELLGL
jgi:HAD superfamily hydrolase (TIGR01509 family)